MPIFLDSPRYVLGVLGFYTTPVVGRRILQTGVIASLVTLLHAGILYLTGRHEASVPGQMVFLVAIAWLGVFGFFRLFATGAMWIFTAVASLFEAVFPVFTHFLLRAYWISFELFLTAGFFLNVVAANGIPFGLFRLGD